MLNRVSVARSAKHHVHNVYTVPSYELLQNKVHIIQDAGRRVVGNVLQARAVGGQNTRKGSIPRAGLRQDNPAGPLSTPDQISRQQCSRHLIEFWVLRNRQAISQVASSLLPLRVSETVHSNLYRTHQATSQCVILRLTPCVAPRSIPNCIE
jgi:hypothetical protein